MSVKRLTPIQGDKTSRVIVRTEDSVLRESDRTISHSVADIPFWTSRPFLAVGSHVKSLAVEVLSGSKDENLIPSSFDGKVVSPSKDRSLVRIGRRSHRIDFGSAVLHSSIRASEGRIRAIKTGVPLVELAQRRELKTPDATLFPLPPIESGSKPGFPTTVGPSRLHTKTIPRLNFGTSSIGPSAPPFSPPATATSLNPYNWSAQAILADQVSLKTSLPSSEELGARGSAVYHLLATNDGTLFDAAQQFTNAAADYDSSFAPLTERLKTQLSHRDETRLDTYRFKLKGLTPRTHGAGFSADMREMRLKAEQYRLKERVHWIKDEYANVITLVTRGGRDISSHERYVVSHLKKLVETSQTVDRHTIFTILSRVDPAAFMHVDFQILVEYLRRSLRISIADFHRFLFQNNLKAPDDSVLDTVNDLCVQIGEETALRKKALLQPPISRRESLALSARSDRPATTKSSMKPELRGSSSQVQGFGIV